MGTHPGRRALSVALALFLGSPILFTLRAAAPEESEMVALGESPEPLMALPLSEAPGATFVITGEEIEHSAAANIFELLRRVPGVDIRYTPMGGHISIRSTGRSPFSEEVLLLIDGSPYNSPDKGGFPGHPNYAGFFPLDRIARIEVIKGPISVLYGANAFGGVINIVSKRAADAVTDRIEGHTIGTTLVGGTQGTFDRAIRAALLKNGLEATLEIGAADSESPIEWNGNADQSRNNLYLALRRGRFWGSLLHQESKHGSFNFDGTATRTARNKVDIADVHYDTRLGSWVVRGAATLNRYRGTTCAVCHNNQTKAPDDAKTNEVGGELEVDQRVRLALRADRTLTDAQDLTFGVEAARDSVDRQIVRLDEVDKAVDNGGVYLQHQWHFSNRTLHLITGVRYDVMEKLDGATSPRFSLVWEPTSESVVRCSWSRAYRAPTWNERFRKQRFLPNDLAPDLILVFQGNPELDRERIDSIEAGVSWRVLPELVIKTDLYYNKIDNFIEPGPDAFVPGSPDEIRIAYENRADAFSIRGGELTVIASPAKQLSFTAGIAYKGLSLERNDPAAGYAPHGRATLTASWTPRAWSFDLAASHSGRYRGSFPDVIEQRPQRSYELYDVAVRRKFSMRAARLSVGIIGRNLSDVHPKETFLDDEGETALRGRVAAVELKVDF